MPFPVGQESLAHASVKDSSKFRSWVHSINLSERDLHTIAIYKGTTAFRGAGQSHEGAMSDNSGAANSSSWTVLTAEETVAETLRPVAEGTEHHENTPSHTAAEKPTESRPGEDAVSAEESHSVKLQQETQETQPERDKDYTPVVESPTHDLPFDPAPDSTPALDSTSASVAPPSSLLEVPAPTGLDPNTHSQSRSLPGNSAPPISDPDSFSDSYTHISSSPDLEEPPALLLNTEPPEEVGLVQEAEGYIQDVHHHYEEGLGQEEEESDLSDIRAKTDSHLEAEVVGEEEEGVSGVRRRRGSLLAALEQIGREEEEEEEDEFRIPQQREQEETGFSLNKCILGAVILLGLGTIIFSGVFLDLDGAVVLPEGDYDARELRETEVVGKQEWLNPEVPLPPPVEVDSTDQLNKLAKEDPRIAVLQAQLLAQKEELKVAQKEAEDGGKERKKREEVEREHGRLKKEMMSLPVLQKENERMKRELESVPVLQKDLETLRATVTELKHSTAKEAASPPVSASVPPPSGQAGDDSQNTAGTIERKVKKPGKGEKTELKEEKTDWNKGGKTDWNKGGKTDWNKGGKTDWNKGRKTDWNKGGKTDWNKGGKTDWNKAGKTDWNKGGKTDWNKGGKTDWNKGGKTDWNKAGKTDWNKGGKTDWNKGGKTDWNKGGKTDYKVEKEWRSGKYDQEKEGKEEKEWKKKEDKKGEWKKDKSSRGDEGKPWKDRGNKMEWKEKSEKKDWKVEKDWKKEKPERWSDSKEWNGEKNGKEEKNLRKGGWNEGRDEWKGEKNGKEEKNLRKGGWNEGRDEWKGEKNGKEDNILRKGGYNKGRDEWKGEKEWKKDKDDYKDLGKGWKERGEKKEWKGEKDWTKKDVSKEWKSKDNRRENEWSDGNRKMEGLKEERNGGNWKRDRGNDKYEKDHHHHHYSKEGQKERRRREKGPPQTHRRPPLEQPDYWSYQRERLQHKPNPQTHCSSVEACAQAEGLLPVTMPEFEALLLGYLVKAERVGVEASKREELSKLTKEFFRDGVFVHDQMSFKDFVEDVEDILEVMVEDEEVEEEVDDFEEEAMNRFSVPGGGEREKWKKDSGRGRV
ncbi:pre-B-cell leukemia transcription factor-interacting protein 1 isoform X4 [Oncorhynchus mykiss]|uniref:Pre-B-cell leukemia homeobox interacting protein 1b n=1 Tax=Oncorhynchus mykiss TaxID=8022 RepID=A0A8K9WTS3_ONCMY|nr:pre-B-cell leukemia transcription factor-interacting protein 1 isoform X4 [Oncorhynchus mykiss]